MHDDDRELRALLRSADPARHHAPLDSHRIEQMLEHTMNDTASQSAPTAATPAAASPAARGRRVWIPIAGVAAAAAAAAIALPLALGGTPSVMALEQPVGESLAAGSCLVISAESLLAEELAFAGRVLSVDGGRVVLEVTERFAGEVADRVEVPQVVAGSDDGSGVPFEADGTYLVAATDGTIAGCGLSGVDDADLRAVYDEAFAG